MCVRLLKGEPGPPGQGAELARWAGRGRGLLPPPGVTSEVSSEGKWVEWALVTPVRAAAVS